MKTNQFSKENNFSFMDPENYKKDLDYTEYEITDKYLQLIVEYMNFIHENIKVKNKSFVTFIIIRGLDTITHVFNYILYTTKHLDLTYYHCQKSFYFYIEFVGQITEDDKMFLKLTTRDATTYVYKKTIFDINNEFQKTNKENILEFREKIERVSSYIRLYQTYLLKIIKKDNFELEKTDFLIKIKDKLNKIPNTSKNKINIFKINSLEKIVDQLYFKIEDDVKFFEINEKILHYFLKNPDLIEKSKDKIILDVFDEKILEPIDKFVEWLLS